MRQSLNETSLQCTAPLAASPVLVGFVANESRVRITLMNIDTMSRFMFVNGDSKEKGGL